ncbi:MAG TPA: hypothetical protein VEI06_06770 [Gemmatimonadaceae bacterium]|nr:hypothetical protein [Gemmatimonadaceae bacterium]
MTLFALAACTSDHKSTPPSRATRPDSGARASAESVAVARDVWNVAEVTKRLTEAGLVVTDSARTSRRPGIGVEGHVLDVSGGRLELYVYPDADARRRESTSLDTTVVGLPALDRPRFIISGNLIAVLVTPKDILAERVELALTARHTGGAR